MNAGEVSRAVRSGARSTWTNAIYRLGLAASAGLLPTACDGHDNKNSPRSVAQTSVEAVHASADAPEVNVAVNGVTALEEVAFAAGSPFGDIDAGETDLAVDAILADGSTVPVLQADDVPLDSAVPATT